MKNNKTQQHILNYLNKAEFKYIGKVNYLRIKLFIALVIY